MGGQPTVRAGSVFGVAPSIDDGRGLGRGKLAEKPRGDDLHLPPCERGDLGRGFREADALGRRYRRGPVGVREDRQSLSRPHHRVPQVAGVGGPARSAYGSVFVLRRQVRPH